ncbi:uncharacterized protein L3040_004208 [Drepanopeziza brunnea f. sp. 'multigermtubi']|uniref:Store-operated calcium entry-associated regulatory factor n=1 Tax=Marssonina brunnea f. sp. multigermtubi (strain MB_m1) TaxID=1072389 RepID=K1Y5M1_MARBU|nr:DUF1183 domain-containing protein [Drepanopeziza brunnea f. sp. 'multigermtubi' MB_m1]EKD20504.1 DUF1183 domain-containing protein [Drepanopeziza brunnea f. sp. 'multigermtubi' MB_m1]KAJ5042815.1 hypothetical protein L3040_004208 [Drepanopeziza brunnea f. sp. 'multigermtubi']
MRLLFPALIALLTLTPSGLCGKKPEKKPSDAILLSEVSTLTLRAKGKTAHRRLPAIPQLICSGPWCNRYSIDRMRCINQGSSYNKEDVEWSCTAETSDDFKLGSTEVTCEGYDSREDPYVLKGSCAVEYRLVLTDKGQEKYGKQRFLGGALGNDTEASTIWKVLFGLIFVGVLVLILFKAGQALPAAGRPRQYGAGGGYGGGGWGGGGGGNPYDPPPPYPGKRYSSQQESWRPGFWSGAAAGAAGGYLAGNRANGQQAPQNNTSWLGGNHGGSSFGSPSRSSSGSSSSVRHESTGFGSTSRR